jgi:hypothetical protein
MGRRVHRSASSLAQAAGGRQVPTLDTTLAYVQACGGDAAEWEARWHALQTEDVPENDAAERAVTESDLEGSDAADDPAFGRGDPPTSATGRPDPSPPDLTPTIAAEPDPTDRSKALPPAAVAAVIGPPPPAGPAPGDRTPPRTTSTATTTTTARPPGGRTAAIAVAATALLAGLAGAGVTHYVDRATMRPAPARAATSSAASDADTLTINSPTEHGKVGLLSDVVIHRSGRRPGLSVWIVTRFEGGSVMNPQGECDSRDGVDYLCARAQFGDPDTSPGTLLRVSAVLVDQQGDLTLRTLQADGYNAATHPVPFLAESAAVVVTR